MKYAILLKLRLNNNEIKFISSSNFPSLNKVLTFKVPTLRVFLLCLQFERFPLEFLLLLSGPELPQGFGPTPSLRVASTTGFVPSPVRVFCMTRGVPIDAGGDFLLLSVMALRVFDIQNVNDQWFVVAF